ncbi:amidohydrolase [Providencia huaxiensis]|uniref:amidohydrolase family protein n=1 Tax=Providencia TaxID=586 RepID=UPI00234A8319|nr:amidohydrolase family protein [Providencia sp. PROV032]HEC8324163.1 amidohydrolase family protein [Providencia rettgeri]
MNCLDSHLHFWDPQLLDYPWLRELPALNMPQLPSHLSSEVEGISGAIVVQADCQPTQGIDEVHWINQLANTATFPIVGIVAWAALEQGEDVIPYLKQLKQLNRVVGVRRSLQNEPESLFHDSNYKEGLLAAAKAGFTLDMCVRASQLPALCSLLDWLFEQMPEARVILDHMGKPDIANKKLTVWQKNISDLAKYPNLWCKISGLPTEADWKNWSVSDLKPYVLHALNAFGTQRCLFGGDWPVVNLAGGYAQWKRCIEHILASFPILEQQAIWYGNAHRVYSISLTE